MEYNAWLVRINIENDEANYLTLNKNVGFLLEDSDYAVKGQLKDDYVYYDAIDWDAVNMKDIRQWLKIVKEEKHENAA